MSKIKMEECKSSDGVATREFKRLRNVIRTQSAEISELKAELEQRDDQITNIEIANQEMLAVADARINELIDAIQTLNLCAAKNMYGETVVKSGAYVALVVLGNKLREQNNG